MREQSITLKKLVSTSMNTESVGRIGKSDIHTGAINSVHRCPPSSSHTDCGYDIHSHTSRPRDFAKDLSSPNKKIADWKEKWLRFLSELIFVNTR